MKAVKYAYSPFCDDDDINDHREEKEPMIKLILEKVDHNLLDLKQIMDDAFYYGYLDIVTFLLENADHEKLDIMKAVKYAYSPFCDDDDINDHREKNEPLMKLILEKVDHDFLVLKQIMDVASRYGYLDVVTFLLENTDNEHLDLMKVVRNAYSPFRDGDDINEQMEKRESMIKLILEKADPDFLILKEIMDDACRYDYLDVVTFLLENTDNEKLDLMKAVNNAYRSISDEDDDEDDNNENRAKKEPLIKLILEKTNHDFLDLKEIMYKACCYGYLDVVTFLLENTDHEKLHVMEAVNKACNQSIDEETDDNSCNENL
ncbi:unnamed protein product [Mytilus edulis]|uniref:Ankyrin repeat protein n=1 Tax=Mytilus edulis TaxID=6550 RepID=A0A8S3Q8H8_MYTED|nr:unnamed protein product [Mytilus edulis]